MDKMSELSQVLNGLISCGEKMIQAANIIKECFSEEAAPAARPEKKEKPEKKEAEAPAAAGDAYSKEEVRALLAAKANEADGRFKARVKALVKKYADSGKFTDIPAESYPDLVKEAEGLADD